MKKFVASLAAVCALAAAPATASAMPSDDDFVIGIMEHIYTSNDVVYADPTRQSSVVIDVIENDTILETDPNTATIVIDSQPFGHTAEVTLIRVPLGPAIMGSREAIEVKFDQRDVTPFVGTYLTYHLVSATGMKSDPATVLVLPSH